MRAAVLPDDLEMILEEYRLSVSAAPLSFSVGFLTFFFYRLSLQRYGLFYWVAMTKSSALLT